MGFLDSLAGGVGGLVGGVTQAVTSYFNTKDTNKTNRQIAEQNLGFQRENLDYQKALQQEIFQREDTAHQREIEDLRAAGINPLATASGGNGANAGSVVPLTELNNNYQAQTTDFSGIGAAGAALDASIQAKAALDQQAQEGRYNRNLSHAQFMLDLQQRQDEAEFNNIQRLAEFARETNNDKLAEKLQESANKLAWNQYYQNLKEYRENEGMREAQQTSTEIANDQAKHDLEIDKAAGTKSGETVDSKYTTGKRVVTDAANLINKADKEIKTEKQKKEEKQIQDAINNLTTAEQRTLTAILKNGQWQLVKRNQRKTKEQWQIFIDGQKRIGGSQNLINTLKLLQKLNRIPEKKQ